MKRAVLLLSFLALFSQPLLADEVALSKGQTLYVPVYSHLFSGPKDLPFNLSVILSIQNTDMHNTIRVSSADYYDSEGHLMRRYFGQPVVLGPLASKHILIREDEVKAGVGANFIVRWQADKAINAPIVECLMIGFKQGQGISLDSQAKVIREFNK